MADGFYHLPRLTASSTVRIVLSAGDVTAMAFVLRALDRIPAKEFGIRIISHRRPVFVQRNDLAHRHVMRPFGGRHQALPDVPFFCKQRTPETNLA